MYGTQGEEDNIQLPRMHREKSSKWKKKYRPRKLYPWKSIKWKKKHPPKHTKDVSTRNESVGDVTGPSTSTKDNHDHLVYSLVDSLASGSAAWISQSKTEYFRELYGEKTPAQTHEHIHREQSSSLRKGEGLKTPAELNIEPRTSATLDSTLGKITEQLTCMDRRFVELEKKLQQVLNCREKRDASPICAQDRKRRPARKLRPAKRQKTRGPEVANYPNTLPVCSVPSSPVVDATSNTPTQDRKTRRAPKLPPAKRQKTRGPAVAKYPYTLPVSNVPSSPVADATSNIPTLFFCSFLL